LIDAIVGQGTFSHVLTACWKRPTVSRTVSHPASTMVRSAPAMNIGAALSSTTTRGGLAISASAHRCTSSITSEFSALAGGRANVTRVSPSSALVTRMCL
jgi:hypothetical protein